MNVKGKVKVVKSTEMISEKFSKREFVLTTNDTYPQDVLFQLTNDKCSLVDGVSVGDDLEVDFNLRGREWTNPQGEVKYFNSLEAWKVYKVSATKVDAMQPNAGFDNDDLSFLD